MKLLTVRFRRTGKALAIMAGNRSYGFVKSTICKAREPWKGEAYVLYVEPLRGEAERSRWTFYESVIKRRSISAHHRLPDKPRLCSHRDP